MLPDTSEERAIFRSRLMDTQAWCMRRARIEDPAGSLRTKLLKPSLVSLVGENQCNWNDNGEPFSEIERLCRKRAEMLERGDFTKSSADLLALGRLLIFYPYETLADGAAFDNSKGFFDYWNIPPWDTWFWYCEFADGQQALFSWVPPQLIPLVSAGVSANPEECIQWLSVRDELESWR
jgi:hypothetical protein